jgi:tetratricopeptide (TPR) repeat protein
MKVLLCATLIMLTTLCVFRTALSQDEEGRRQNGLPTLIAPRGGDNTPSGSNATINGVVVIQGPDENSSLSTLTIVVKSNGREIERRAIQNKGAFSFTNMPRLGVSLVLEADNEEVAVYQLGNLNPPPLDNRQDIIVTSEQLGRAARHRNEIITILNSYRRTPDNQKILDNALEASRRKKYELSLKLFRQLLGSDPNDFVAWNELGNLYFAAEKTGDAESAYNMTLTIKTDFAPSLFNLGKLLLAQKKYDSSIENLARAVALSPDSADINQCLGEAYLGAKKGSKAVGYLYRAIELAPIEKAEIHLRLAALYNAANMKGRAAAEYKMFLTKVPKYAERQALEKYIKENSPK